MIAAELTLSANVREGDDEAAILVATVDDGLAPQTLAATVSRARGHSLGRWSILRLNAVRSRNQQLIARTSRLAPLPAS